MEPIELPATENAMNEIPQAHIRWIEYITRHQAVMTDDQLAEGLHTTVASIRLIRKKYHIERA